MLASMRSRVTAAATLGTLIALTLAAIALHTVLSRSLSAQLDDTLSNRAFDVADTILFTNELDSTSFPFDGVTFIGVVEPPTETEELLLEIHNDDAPDVTEVHDLITAPGFSFGEPVDASLPSLDLIEGDTNLRLVAVEVEPGAEIVVVAQSLDGIDRTVRQVDAFLLLSVPLLTAAVGLLVWILAGRALDPVEAMRRDVEHIALTSDLSQRIPAAGRASELDRLGTTMNSMLDRLAQSRERERRFSADAAHELRSPLASIAAQLDVDEAHPETADLRRTAARIRQETARLRHLVDDLLLLARSNDHVPADLRLLDLDDIIATAVSCVTVPESVELRVPPPTGTQIRGDAVGLERLFTNVLSNAVRHAVHGVEIEVEDRDGIVAITVDDDGAGIPASDRERVFERFARLDEARSRDGGGSGLGLALAREIAQRHDGTLAVGDARLGGASLRLELPSA